MAAPAHLSEREGVVWDEVVAAYGAGAAKAIEGPELEAYVGQLVVLRDAQARLEREGLVVADPKGFPIPHPAIAIAKAAQVEIREWGDRFKRPEF